MTTTKEKLLPPFILFADDDAQTLKILAKYADSLGWAYDTVKTAREIISKVNENCIAGGRCYDALVCDVNYFDENPDDGPRISGVAAARAIRENHPDLPIVFVSGYAGHLIRAEIGQVRGELFQKPVNFEALFERLAFLVHWTRSIAAPGDIPKDRRKASINRSGYQRRRSDQAVKIPEILSTTYAAAREEKHISRRGSGH